MVLKVIDSSRTHRLSPSLLCLAPAVLAHIHTAPTIEETFTLLYSVGQGIDIISLICTYSMNSVQKQAEPWSQMNSCVQPMKRIRSTNKFINFYSKTLKTMNGFIFHIISFYIYKKVIDITTMQQSRTRVSRAPVISTSLCSTAGRKHNAYWPLPFREHLGLLQWITLQSLFISKTNSALFNNKMSNKAQTHTVWLNSI